MQQHSFSYTLAVSTIKTVYPLLLSKLLMYRGLQQSQCTSTSSTWAADCVPFISCTLKILFDVPLIKIRFLLWKKRWKHLIMLQLFSGLRYSANRIHLYALLLLRQSIFNLRTDRGHQSQLYAMLNYYQNFACYGTKGYSTSVMVSENVSAACCCKLALKKNYTFLDCCWAP